jgi:hypothetical protein
MKIQQYRCYFHTFVIKNKKKLQLNKIKKKFQINN